MSTPPPYTNITGISRAVMKDNAQESITDYNGNARPGELVVDLETNPPALFVGNNLGQLTQLGTGDYGNANVVTLLSAFGSNTISTTGNIDAGQVILINGTVIKDTAGNAVSIGVNAGTNSQGNRAVAIGLQAGETSQGVGGIAIGEQAGQISQGVLSVAVGYLAGANAQSFSAVAIGAQAGETAQGSGAIAIGDLAGRTSQASNSIIINATGANLDQTTANTLTVKPVRAVTGVTFAAPDAGSVPAGFSPMYYNPTTGEIIVITT